MRISYFLSTLALLAVCVQADLFLQNPRGSNNRYSRDQNNQARLFDSQNNNNGGYGWGPTMTYYAGSYLAIEYTATHSCGLGGSCEIVLQYMCDPLVRDGTNDNTPPTNIEDLRSNEQEYLSFGYHEPSGYFKDCNTRQRNKGLFISDQNIGESAVNTRQNDGGTRRGFECDEERDYYPYWHPSPWKDIAILTSNTSRCSYYKAESQNVKPKGACVEPNSPPSFTYGYGTPENNAAQCATAGNRWVEAPAWNIPAPDCVAAPVIIDDSAGINTYVWKIPDSLVGAGKCVLRIRSNHSTSDYGAWSHLDDPAQGMVDARFNGANSPVRFNPTILYGQDTQLTITVDTSQYGRTFQDRSHTFLVASRPGAVPQSAKVWNLNVRGRRGNLVQYVANELRTAADIQTHICLMQSLSCDTIRLFSINYMRNDGRLGEPTERSNMVQISDPSRVFPVPLESQTLFPPALAQQLAHAHEGDTPYFNVAPLQMSASGVFHFANANNNQPADNVAVGSLYVGQSADKRHRLCATPAAGALVTPSIVILIAVMVASLIL